MSNPQYKCFTCGSLSIKIISWISIDNKAYHFCSRKCKEEYLEVTHPLGREKEKEDEKENKGILPEVRSFVAHKKGKRVTVVRGDSGVHGGSNPNKD
jgi:endogenous inhibitor of DNA gyrase (YacG/DUF329 family)